MKLNRMHLWTLLAAVLLIRLLSLGTYPLMDTTEARYGEMARLMVETGNWLMPQFDYGVPFWGKPPLFTWMSAIGIELFGVNEFAVRLPHFLAGVLTIILTTQFARRLGISGLLTAVVLASTVMFSVAAGAVMTDMALTLGMTLAMIGFYRCWLGERAWGYAGFIGLAIGLLAKGPLVLVLFCLACGPWLLWQHRLACFQVLWQRFPLVSGTLLMLAIAVPWYVMAEQATPGFLDYFIVGEHFKRFTVSGWQGDLYGTAHSQPRGMIWLFWLAAGFPWSLVLLAQLWIQRKEVVNKAELLGFLLLWMMAPLILFTLSGNILIAYALPCTPALSLLVAWLLRNSKDRVWIKSTAAIVPILLMTAALYIQHDVGEKKSDKVFFEHTLSGVPVYYIGERPYSGQYYSQGQAKLLDPTQYSKLSNNTSFQLIGELPAIRELIRQKKLSCTLIYNAASDRSLYLCGTRPALAKAM